MATNRSFNEMLNEYVTNELLTETLVKRDWLMTNVKKDNGWKGGTIPVPFRAAGNTSVKFGALTAESDIAQSTFVRGSLTDYVEVWASLLLNQRDLMEHGEGIPEKTFLKIVPDEIDNLMGYFKEVVSVSMMEGSAFSAVTDVTNAATGVLVVTHIDRFQLGQKVIISDETFYVKAINLETSAITVSETRGGAAADVHEDVAKDDKVYHDGGTGTTFNNIKDMLLSYGNGGSANIHGKSKLSAPYLQAHQISGSTMTDDNMLEVIFDGWVKTAQLGRGQANKVLMSLPNLAIAMKILEAKRGQYVVKSTKNNMYGWKEIEIANLGNGQDLQLVGLVEMSNDWMPIVDMNTFKLYSNGFFRKRTAPDSKQYYEIRGTDGYKYVVDLCFFGDLACLQPSANGVIHSISI